MGVATNLAPAGQLLMAAMTAATMAAVTAAMMAAMMPAMIRGPMLRVTRRGSSQMRRAIPPTLLARNV
jgi:hypothetical protein